MGFKIEDKTARSNASDSDCCLSGWSTRTGILSESKSAAFRELTANVTAAGRDGEHVKALSISQQRDRHEVKEAT